MRTWANVYGSPANGFEDRGANVQARPQTFAPVHAQALAFHDRSRWSVTVRRLGCLLGCQRPLGVAPTSALTANLTAYE